MSHQISEIRGASAQLAALCDEGAARARDGGAAALVSFTWGLPATDPLAALERRGTQEGYRFYWEHPRVGFALAAGGCTLRLESAGSERFADIGAALRRVWGRAVRGVGPAAARDGACAVGGFGFFDALDETEWPGFRPGQLVIPAWTLRRDSQGTTATVFTSASPGEDGPRVLRRMLELGEAVQAAPHPPRVPGCAASGQVSNRVQVTADPARERRLWVEAVDAALAAIRRGELTKVVLARAMDLDCEHAPSPFVALRNLRRDFPDCYTFLVDPGAGRVFLGATPECLARFEPGRVHLGALAGTAPRGASPAADAMLGRQLLENPKEQAEHRIVVDGILDVLAPLGLEVLMPDRPTLARYKNVQHLHTPIEVRHAADLPPIEFLGRLHPTPAVGGQPKHRTAHLIRSQERFDRGWYAGPVGWLDAQGGGEFAVALRAGLIGERRVRLYAGCGIVADSDPEREFAETQLKLQPMLGALALD